MKRIILAFLLVGVSSSMVAVSRELKEAIRADNLNEVKRLIEDEGENVNAQSPDGETALMVAAYGGFLNIVKYLVERGANVNATTLNGSTVL